MTHGRRCRNKISDGRFCHHHQDYEPGGCVINSQALAAKMIAAEFGFPSREKSQNDEVDWEPEELEDARFGVSIWQTPEKTTGQVYLRVTGPVSYVIRKLPPLINYDPVTASHVAPILFDGVYHFANNATNRATLSIIISNLRAISRFNIRTCRRAMMISRANMQAIAARELAGMRAELFAVKGLAKLPDNFLLTAGGIHLEMRVSVVRFPTDPPYVAPRLRLSGEAAINVLKNLVRMGSEHRAMSVLELNYCVTRGKGVSPEFCEDHLLWFNNNETNGAWLKTVAKVLDATAARFSDWEIRDDAPPVEIGDGMADCPVMPPDLETASKGLEPINSIIQPRQINGYWTFGSMGVRAEDLEPAIKHMRSRSTWGKFVFSLDIPPADELIEDNDRAEALQSIVDKIRNSRRGAVDGQSSAGVVSWGDSQSGHARYLVYPGGGTRWIMIDPWMVGADYVDDDEFRFLKEAMMVDGWELFYRDRRPEQASDACCVYISLARAVQTVRNGFTTHPEPLDECILNFVARAIFTHSPKPVQFLDL